MSLNTCGNSEVLTKSRKAPCQFFAALGIIWSTVRSTSEPLICWTIGLNGAPTSSVPMSQAMTRTDSALASVPPSESTMRAGSQVTWLRTIAPRVDEANCPMVADRNTITMASRACSVGPSTIAWAMGGAMNTPRTAPPTKPRKLKAPMMKPWRYPDMAKAITKPMRIRSRRSPCTVTTVASRTRLARRFRNLRGSHSRHDGPLSRMRPLCGIIPRGS